MEILQIAIMTTNYKGKHIVLSSEDEITFCEHIDKGSSNSEISCEYKITVLSISCSYISLIIQAF